MPVKRGSGASVRPWRHEISRRLDEYRDKQRVDGPEFQALAPTERPPAFSNPRMSLKWAKAEKVSLLGEDLLSKG